MDWKVELEEKGYVVIPGILSAKECARHVKKLSATMKNVVKDGEWESFVETRAPNGVIHGLDNLRTLWEVRSNPAITSLFQELYGPEESLYLYIDRFNYRPPKLPLPFHCAWHIDENPFCPQSDYQGFVSLTNITPKDACLGILEKSHWHVKEAIERFGPFTQDQYDWFVQKGCVERRVATPAGSLVIWNSGCVHNPLNSLRETPRRRVVAYVRYFPTYRLPFEYRQYALRTYPEYIGKKGIDCLSSEEIMQDYPFLIKGTIHHHAS